jgi:hypothetical protein
MNTNHPDFFDVPELDVSGFKPAARSPLVRTVGIWISGLLASCLIGFLIGSILDGPYRATNDMLWGVTAGLLSGTFWGAMLGMLVFTLARLLLASEPSPVISMDKLGKSTRLGSLTANAGPLTRRLHTLESIGAGTCRAKVNQPSPLGRSLVSQKV